MSETSNRLQRRGVGEPVERRSSQCPSRSQSESPSSKTHHIVSHFPSFHLLFTYASISLSGISSPPSFSVSPNPVTPDNPYCETCSQEPLRGPTGAEGKRGWEVVGV